MQRFAAQTTRRVLCIPELLQRIFQLCPGGANTANARVSKAWNEEATRIIWHDVFTSDLFPLLAPLVSHLSEDGINYVCLAFNYPLVKLLPEDSDHLIGFLLSLHHRRCLG